MSCQILRKDGVVRIRFQDEIVPADLQSLGRLMDRIDEESPVTPHRLVDLADSHGAQINFSRIAAFAETRTAKRMRNSIRVALVAPAPHQFGVARMFQSLLTNPQVELQVFRDLAGAEAWVLGALETPVMQDIHQGGVFQHRRRG